MAQLYLWFLYIDSAACQLFMFIHIYDNDNSIVKHRYYNTNIMRIYVEPWLYSLQ